MTWLAFLAAVMTVAFAQRPKNVVDEVVWIVGDEAIFRSEVEEHYVNMQQEGTPINGDPYCAIPEMLAVEKLYLHQAKIDTVTAPESQVQQGVDKRINFFIANLGSKEKVEEYFRKPLPSLRNELLELMRNQYIIQTVQQNLTSNIKSTPNDVRKYFNNLEPDSIPYVPMQVEVQIITVNPVIPTQEIEDIKAQLRDFTDRVNRGESEFSTLAIMYSDDDGSAMQGGELGFHNRSEFVPEFSNVAFNLNDPKKVSRIVETEFGYHIIQLIEKRGDQVNVRHILRIPKVRQADLDSAMVRLDSLRSDLIEKKVPFEEVTRFVSQDKDTKNNRGVMVNENTGSTRFEMQELPVDVARAIEKMQPGEISKPFIMKDAKRNRDVVSMVKLTSRTPGHRANLSDDYNLIKEKYENAQREKILKDWVEKKIKETYVHIEDGWDKCDFRYEGWIRK